MNRYYCQKANNHFLYLPNVRRFSRWAERNRKTDALRLRYDRQTSGLPNSLRSITQ